MTDFFYTWHDFVKRWEGGWANDKHDPGGLTKWGVTIRTIIAKGLDFNGDGAVNNAYLRDMTEAQAVDLYRSDYWDVVRCGELPPPLALLVYNASVNQGPGRAAKFLQHAVGAAVDGRIGPNTMAAVAESWAENPRDVLQEFVARQAVHYSSLSIVARFGLGWFRRLSDALILAVDTQRDLEEGLVVEGRDVHELILPEIKEALGDHLETIERAVGEIEFLVLGDKDDTPAVH